MLRLTIFLILSSALGASGVDYINCNFTGASAWRSSVIVPASSSPCVFPDGISRIPGNFRFKAGTSSVWELNSGANLIFHQSWANAYNRFLIGEGDGSSASLTFTTSSLLNPGKLSCRGDNLASIRIGEAATNSQGTLRIDGGVHIQSGYIHGEGPSPALQIVNGRLDVFSGNALKRLNGIAITLGPKGKLWVEDSGAIIKSAASFSSFAPGATITAPGGTLIFQNSTLPYSLWGNWSYGTLITVNSSADSDQDGLPDTWEIAAQLDPLDNGSMNPINGPTGDPDSDGSTNLAEFQLNTNPRDSDTDHDILNDGAETNTSIFISSSNTGSAPLSQDTDGDGVGDGAEVAQNTDPNDIDSPSFDPDIDHDGLPTTWEIAHRLNPNDSSSTNDANGDPDLDGLPNSEEFLLDSDPQVNESGYAWQPRPAKASMLVIAAHPDDEGIFFGGTIPYYTGVTKTSTMLLSMTSGDYTSIPLVREQQLRAAAWTYGLRYQPLFPRFRDLPASAEDTWDLWADGVIDRDDVAAGRRKAGLYIAKMIRRYRPEVIATHGVEGEYGHNDHKATCQAVIDAWTLAADPDVEIEGYPAWQPKKLYVHEWGSNRLFHDYWETPSTLLNGKTPRQVTLAGLQFHYNQSNVSTVYQTGEVNANWDAHPSEWWGLYSSTVGLDTIAPDFTIAGMTYSGWAKGDFLEHITIPTDSAPLVACPASIDVSYPWSTTMSAVVTDDSPASAQTFSWTMVSGPGTVSFTPSANVRNPVVYFTDAGRYILRITADDGNSVTSREATVNALPSPAAVFRAINCGGGELQGVDGTAWLADAYYAGGSPVSTAPALVTGTADDGLFQRQRTGNCSYAIPIPNGTYHLTLRFAETKQQQSGLRRFHINLENTRVTTSLDLFSEAGYAKAFDRSYSVSVSDNFLNLQLTGEFDQPSIAAILVRSIDPNAIQPPIPSPVVDTDGDGISDVDEFTCGTSPTSPDPAQLTINPITGTVRFGTRIAEGAAYQGRVRRYRVETSSDLEPGSWNTIWQGTADGTEKQVLVPGGAPKGFFRLVTILE